jgi:hypothetical protein
MTNDEDMLIRERARRICANEAMQLGLDDWRIFLSGDYDHLPWMRIASAAVLAGIIIGRETYAD